MSVLSDTIAERLKQQRNPNLSTDRGLNSVSPYFLPTGQVSSTVQQGWSDTGAAVDGYASQGRARIKAADDLAAAQSAAAAAQQAQEASETQARAASDAQAAAYAKQQRDAAKQYANLQKQIKSLKRDAQAAAQIRSTAGGPSGSRGADLSGAASIATKGARRKALALAQGYVGSTPYVLGGTSHKGIDCSGLVQAVYTQLGYRIPVHGATWQGRNIPGTRVPWGSKAAQPGDIVAWKDGSHIAIYAGNGQIIEAARPGTKVRYHSLWTSPSNVTVIHLNL